MNDSVSTPATENEIAAAIRWAAEHDAIVVRKLAFERDTLKQHVETLKSAISAALSMLKRNKPESADSDLRRAMELVTDGITRICESRGGEGQIKIEDKCGDLLWWACPTCRPETPSELPEAVAGTEAECPFCHLVHDLPEIVGLRVVDCECGGRFEVEKTIVFSSRPLEIRK